jgi:hypothetical protein
MKKFGLILVLTVLLSNLFGWGGLAHRIITENAMNNLPDEMQLNQDWKSYITEHCSDPDWRKKETPGEAERHYLDIDYYEEFNRGEMIFEKDELIAKYGKEIVIDQGVLPWAILETYENLVKAFSEKDEVKILLYSSNLAHYIEDGSQPQHVILNYNGKHSDQYGIHGRYERDMIRAYELEIRETMLFQPVEKIELDLEFIFDYITNTNSLSGLIFEADLHALKFTKEREDKYDEEYLRILWFKTEYITKLQFNVASKVLSSLIYSAWIDAGKPVFE